MVHLNIWKKEKKEMKKKLILILSLALLCVSLFTLSVSAECVTYELVDNLDNLSTESDTEILTYLDKLVVSSEDDNSFTCYMLMDSGSSIHLLITITDIEAFQKLYANMSYNEFVTLAQDNICSSSSYNYSCLPEEAFDYFLNYGKEDSTSNGMQDFSTQLKQLYTDYEYECKSNGTSVTAEGFHDYVENSLYSEEFKEAYKTYGAQEVLSGMYSAGASSQSGSSGSTGGSNEDVGSGQNGSPNISDEELTEGESMVETPACPLCNPDSTCDHYIMGYQQGFHDALLSDLNKDNLQQAFDQGYTYSNSEDFQTTINVAKQESIEEFKQSEEYNKALQDNLEEWQSSEEFSQIIDSTIEESVNDYKTSEEYNTILNAQYSAGVQAGYDSGYSEAAELVYDKGVLAGMAQYQSSAEYQNSMQGFYNDGYFDGYDKGHADGKNVPNVTGLVLLIISIIGAVILFAVVSRKIKKKKRGSK